MFEVRDNENYFRLIPRQKNFTAPDWIFSELHVGADGFQKVILLEINILDYHSLLNYFKDLYQHPSNSFSFSNSDRDFGFNISGDGARQFDCHVELSLQTVAKTKLQYRMFCSDIDKITNQLMEIVRKFA